MKRLIYSLGSLFLLVSCGASTTPAVSSNTTTEAAKTTVTEAEATTEEAKSYRYVKINLSNNKTITCELYPEVAPISVQNFLGLIDQNYYNDVVFHRVIPDFMIQTGGYYVKDEKFVTRKDTVPSIKGEFSANGVTNDIKHVPGVLSMARATANDSGSSEFFICVATCAWLDGQYAAFGKTVDEESLQAAIEISTIPTVNIGGGLTDFPYQPVYISSIEKLEKLPDTKTEE